MPTYLVSVRLDVVSLEARPSPDESLLELSLCCSTTSLPANLVTHPPSILTLQQAMATTNRGKGGCRCGWNDHLCVCSILKPLQGEDTGRWRSLPSAASVDSFDFDFDNAALEEEMMPSDDKSPKKKKENSEDLLLTSDYSRNDLMASR
jgi:hypothetical protein